MTLIDEYTRECLALKVARRINSFGVIETLADAMMSKGIPEHVRCDNGPEMVAKALRERLAQLGTKPLYIEPGSPWENGYCESFNGKLRDECLKLEIFYSLKEAQVVIGTWRDHYNRVRPHSALGYRPPAPMTLEVITQQLPTSAIMQQALNSPGSKSRSGHGEKSDIPSTSSRPLKRWSEGSSSSCR